MNTLLESNSFVWRGFTVDSRWAAVYGVIQSRTWLKRLSSSSSSSSKVAWFSHQHFQWVATEVQCWEQQQFKTKQNKGEGLTSKELNCPFEMLYVALVFVQSLSCINSFPPHGLHQVRLPCPSLSPGVFSDSCPLSQWCHPIISSFVTSCPQSFPASGSFPMNSLLYNHILAWEIPWTEDPARLQSMGSQESDMTYWVNHHHIYI